MKVKHAIAPLCAFIISYLVLAFIKAELNPFMWEEGDRFLTAFSGFLLAVISLMVVCEAGG